MQYATVIVDLPVIYEVWSEKSRTPHSKASDHYNLMTWDDMIGLGPLVKDVMHKNACLLMWMFPPTLIQQLDLARAWGFTYKTKLLCWVKTYKSGGFLMGMGHWTRANSEDLFLFTRGNPHRLRRDIRQVLHTVEQDRPNAQATPPTIYDHFTTIYDGESPCVIDQFRGHSVKPESAQTRVEQLLQGPYLEMFGRRYRDGWTVIGDALDGLDIRESLRRVAANEPIPYNPEAERFTSSELEWLAVETDIPQSHMLSGDSVVQHTMLGG